MEKDQIKVLVAGATGYLGGHLVQALKKQGYWVRVLVRNENQASKFSEVDDVFVGQITNFTSLEGVTNGIDHVMTTVGITRQKDGLTYMDVDYGGNHHLLQHALKTGVKKFLYVSAINGDKLRHLKIFAAKERFVDELKASGLDYRVIRPNGFFSDMRDFLEMGKSGRAYLFGDGHFRLNPIHGEDLAEFCLESLTEPKGEYTVGGPDLLTQKEIAEMALRAWNKEIKVTFLPDWVRKMVIWTMRTLISERTYGPYEFFLSAMAIDNAAPQYGNYHLIDFFESEVGRLKVEK